MPSFSAEMICNAYVYACMHVFVFVRQARYKLRLIEALQVQCTLTQLLPLNPIP